MKKRKIVWFNTSLEQSGGGERLSLEVVKSCRKLGYDAQYITYSFDNKNTFDGYYETVKPISLGKKNLLKFSKISILERIRRIIWLRKQINKINPNLVITSGTWGHVVDIYFATLLKRTKYVTHIFGSMFAFTPEKESLKYARIFKKNFKKVRNSLESYKKVVPLISPKLSIIKRLKNEISAIIKYISINKSHRLFVLSTRNQLETKLLYGKDSIVLQGAFSEDIFNYSVKHNIKKDYNLNDKKVVFSVGRLAENKRIDLAIVSFSKTLAHIPNTYLLIGGSGPERTKLEHLVNSLNLNERIIFIGYVEENKLYDYYATCDLFLHLDLADFDIAPLEALAVGAKVIWTYDMDIKNLYKKIDNLIIVDSKPDLISRSIIDGLNSRKTILTEKEIKILKKFSWENFTRTMLKHVDFNHT